MKKTPIPALALISVFAAISFANDVPYTGSIGIKDAGMAGAYAPFIEDGFAQFSNPARLAFVARQRIGMTYYNLYESGLLGAVTYAVPFFDRGTLSVSALTLDAGSIEERDANNILVSSFSDSYASYYVSYGITLLPYLSAGASIKYLNHSFYHKSFGSAGIDAGLMLTLPLDIGISVSADNLVKPVFDYGSGSSQDSMPMTGKIGIGWEHMFPGEKKSTLRLSANASLAEYGTYLFSAGAEYSLYDMYSLRAGISGLGFAAGATLSIFGAEIDYALVTGDIALLHKFSVSYSFGDNIRQMESSLVAREAMVKNELIEKIKRETIQKYKEWIEMDIMLGSYENARTTVDKALVWDPYYPDFIRLRNQVDELLKKSRIQAYMRDADRLMKENLYIDALVSLKNVLDLDPENSSAKTQFARAQELIRTLGENNLGIEEGNKAVIRQHFESGLNNYAAGNYEKAISEWDQVIKASPLQRQVYNYIKQAQDKIKKIEVAETEKKSSLEKQKSSIFNRAVLLYSKGDFEGSIQAWKDLLKIDPESKDAKNNMEKITKEYLELQKQKLEW
ncbi:MAG: hypothetical protein LLG37_02925 [Spirochaetia bacterium]|nr:hypothetical protein [Spirochaetia bacterium]